MLESHLTIAIAVGRPCSFGRVTTRMLVVCTANVCRSPMAAALLAHRCDELGVKVSVSSAGVQAHQLPVDPDAVAVLAEHGLDISAHQPRSLDRAMLEDADLVITMTRDHLRTVATTIPGVFRRAFTARELARKLTRHEHLDLDVLNEGRSPRDLMGNDAADDIADPYGKSLQWHRLCAEEIDEAMRTIAHALVGAHT